MADTPTDQPPKPRPARDRGGEQDGDQGHENTRDRGHDDSRVRDAVPAASQEGPPTPARALLEETETEEGTPESAAPPAEKRPNEERVLDVGGDAWTVRVGGRGRTGSASGSAPLVLLTFRRAGAEEIQRESLVVGEALDALGEEDLRAAFHRGRTPPEPGSRKEIFPEVGGRNRGRDG